MAEEVINLINLVGVVTSLEVEVNLKNLVKVVEEVVVSRIYFPREVVGVVVIHSTMEEEVN